MAGSNSRTATTFIESASFEDVVDLRSVLDGMSEGVAVLAPDFTILDVNAEGLRMESRSREEVVGRSHWEAYPGTEHTPLGAAYKQAMRDRESVKLEHRHVWDDGRISWLDMRAVPIAQGRIAVFYRDVTERHLADRKLYESEQRFRGAVEAFADALWTNDAQGRMAGEQPGWAALTGQSFDEYQGFGWSRAVHPDDAQPTIDAWNAAVAARRPFAFEHRVRRYDGVWRRFAIRAVPIIDDHGSIREWVGVHSDITELRQNEERFRQLAENIEAVFYIHEIDEQRISYVSPAYERIWQLPVATLLTEPASFLRAIHPEDRARVEAALQRQLAGENTETRYRLVRADGSIRHIHDRSFVTFNPGDEARRVVGIAEDVTITTQARLQLARNAETFEALVRDNPFGVYVVDQNFELVQVSQGARRVFEGIEPLVGRDFAEILRIVWQEPFASEAIARFRHTLATGETYVSGRTIEARGNINSTEAYDWRIERIALPDGSNGVVCYFYDLSERMALEGSLTLALADKDMLLREIDHRVRNSLAIVSALLAMQSGSAQSADVKQALSIAASRIQAIARVHERLYKSTELGIVEFGGYIEEICRDLRTSLHHGSIAFQIKTVPVDLTVDQAVPLGLIANELVTNAFKHCADDATIIGVELTATAGRLSLTVSNNGATMAIDYTPTSQSGLGMRVVAQLTRQLGGTLEFPVAGGAARFCITVPLNENAGQVPDDR